jgi:two-component system response regulator DesR
MIRVLVAEDMHLIRGALVALIGLEEDMQVVAELDRGDLIEPTALRVEPDVAVLDIDLPGLDGLTAARRLQVSLPACQSLILTGLSQPSHLLRALEGRVRGFLPKDAPASELADAIRRVAVGGSALDPTIVSQLLSKRRDKGPLDDLTPREREVVELMAEGRSNQGIADRLDISERGVQKHVTSLLDKLGIPAGTDDHRRVLAVLTFLRA